MAGVASSEELLSAVTRCYPQLAVRSWQAIGEGWMSRAFLLNDEHVVRFAKNADAGADLLKERALLPVIAGHVSLSIPAPELWGTGPSGLPFQGHRLVRGVILDERAVAGFSMPERQGLAEQLATFMTELQSVPAIHLEPAPEVMDLRARCTSDTERLARLQLPLPPATASYIERRFAEFLSTPSFFDHAPRLIHADISLDHLVFAADRRTLIGIIDFGDLSMGDPDYEYLYLLEELGEPFCRQVLAARGVPEPDLVMRKASYFVTFDLVHLILGGAAQGIRAWIDEGIAALSAEAEAAER